MADIKEVVESVVKTNKDYSKPIASYKMMYESPQNQLEPIYYWLLDFVEGLGFKVEKVVDNFMSSPGSGHFSDMSQKATIMQQQGGKLSADLHQLIKSTINIVYDLREFEQRLSHYKDEQSDDPKRKETGILALKNIWLDSVDLPKRGRGSIHQMSAELGYVTLRDSFMIANSIEDVDKMTIKNEKDNTNEKYSGTVNESVARVLAQRIDEFLKWKGYSYKELNKRYKIEKHYLKSQVETMKLYSAWMKPYFKAAEQLRQDGFNKSAALVNAFSTSMFELTLMGISKADPEDIKQIKKKSNTWGQLKGYNVKRDYNSVVLINLKYRGHLIKADQKGNYASMFNGKVNMNFDAYSLNSEELGLMKKKLEKDDIAESLKSLDIAESSRKEMQEDFEYFLKDEDEREDEDKKKKEKKKRENDINPFSALFKPFLSSKKSKTKKIEKKAIENPEDIKPDNWVEKHLRIAAANSAASRLYAAYDIYKKSHRMPSSPENFDNFEINNPKAKNGEINVSPSVKNIKEAFQKPDKE
jgi:hypothetical protein